MNAIEYRIASCGGTDNNTYYLQEQVNELASEGWMPLGGLVIDADGGAYQAMIRSLPCVAEKSP